VKRQTRPFAKMHGCGNDYVVLDAVRALPADPAALARAMCDRRLGVGADGLLLAVAAGGADIGMRMLNPDGSEAEMCGNGLRCLAHFAASRGLVPHPGRMRVGTGAGVLTVEADGEDWTVDMGPPRLERAEVPMRGPPGRVVDEALEAGGATWRVTAVSMGNPHAVLFVDDVDGADLPTLGRALETHAAFPRRTNVEIAAVEDRRHARQRTWERGVGETAACGTGACAVAVAGVLTGRLERAVTVHLRGGDLAVRWDESSDHVFMTGPAVEVFDGRWPLD
jgi:diaminopimelate epimerase